MIHDFVSEGFDWKVTIPNTEYKLVHWPPGALDGQEHFGFEHIHVYPADPDRPGDTETRALVAPFLDRHTVTGPFRPTARTLATVSPSILCDCGLHGFLTDGVWRAV